MGAANDYINRIITYMDSAKQSEWIPINSISSNKERFIEAIKFCIDLRGKEYELNNDNTKVRRI